MKNDSDYSWRSMTSQEFPNTCEMFKAGNPQVSEENLERLGQFSLERLAADTLVAIAPDGGIAAAGITAQKAGKSWLIGPTGRGSRPP